MVLGKMFKAIQERRRKKKTPSDSEKPVVEGKSIKRKAKAKKRIENQNRADELERNAAIERRKCFRPPVGQEKITPGCAFMGNGRMIHLAKAQDMENEAKKLREE